MLCSTEINCRIQTTVFISGGMVFNHRIFLFERVKGSALAMQYYIIGIVKS